MSDSLVVKAHRNLYTGGWSVKAGSEAVQHVTSLLLFECEFKVWEGGRRKVVRTGVKGVHAFVVGQPAGRVDRRMVERMRMVRVSYNPFEKEFFFEKKTGRKVESCRWAALLEDGSLWVKK